MPQQHHSRRAAHGRQTSNHRPLYIVWTQPSGRATALPIQFVADLNPVDHTGTAQLTVNGQLYALSITPQGASADPVVQQVLGALQAQDWSQLYALSDSRTRAAVTEATFTGWFAADQRQTGAPTGVRQLTGVRYQVERAGTPFARALLELTFPGGATRWLEVRLIADAGQWRFATFAPDTPGTLYVTPGGPYTVAPGGTVTVTAIPRDPGGGVLAFGWDLDNNGSYETAGQTATFSAAGIAVPATRTIGVQVTSSTGATATAQTTVSIGAAPSGGKLMAWGRNNYGQLGDGTLVGQAPAPTFIIDNMVAVSAGAAHTVALKADGTVWAWGANAHGQLGDGTTTDRATPARVPGLSGVIAVAATAGYDSSLALKADGTMWAWGRNNYGQMGDGTTTDRVSPAQVPGLTGVTALAAGQGFVLALKGDGTVWAWGMNGNQQLGTTTGASCGAPCSTTPLQVSGLTGVTALAAGASHSLALKGDGTVWAWGYGRLGDGTTSQRATPAQVPNLTGVASIAAGSSYSLAVKSDGTAWAWGSNGSGQLGDGTTTARGVPTQISSLGGVAQLAGGLYHTLALKTDGTVWSWGQNLYGQLGDGTTSTASRLTPVRAVGLTNVTQIAAGDEYSIAVHSPDAP